MLVSIPFVYFSLLSYFQYRKRKRLDLPCLITIIFAISGFFSILIDFYGIRSVDTQNYQISVTASLAYCSLLSICIFPLMKYSRTDFLSFVPFKNEKLLKLFSFIVLFWFFIYCTLNFENVTNVLTGDMESYRRMVYDGEMQNSWLLKLPSFIRPFFALLNIVFGCKWALILLAFYSKFVQRLPNKYFIFFLLASISGPMDGITMADRSATAYWIMELVAMSILFSPIMSDKEKRWMFLIGAFLIGILVLYLVSVTVSRFADRSYGNTVSGVEGSLITYFGQVYINFCYFFDNYTPPFINLGIIFPFTYKYLLGVPTGGTVIQAQMEMLTNFETGVFYTFIGHIIVGAGKYIAIVYCFVLSVISYIVIPKIYNKNLSVDTTFLYFAIFSVTYLGIFANYYAASSYTAGLLFSYLLLRLLK